MKRWREERKGEERERKGKERRGKGRQGEKRSEREVNRAKGACLVQTASIRGRFIRP